MIKPLWEVVIWQAFVTRGMRLNRSGPRVTRPNALSCTCLIYRGLEEEEARPVVTLKPIGTVKSIVKEPRHGGWADVVSRLEIDGEYAAGMKGLEDYSHVTVVYWMNQVDSCTITYTPQGRKDVPEVGIFACRCPTRPNPIAVSTAELVRIDGSVLTVKGLDALDGTPIIDVKPYTPQYDLRERVRVPYWVNRLEY
jgi:tRNA (adenine37-N6)-methyltransferase